MSSGINWMWIAINLILQCNFVVSHYSRRFECIFMMRKVDGYQMELNDIELRIIFGRFLNTFQRRRLKLAHTRDKFGCFNVLRTYNVLVFEDKLYHTHKAKHVCIFFLYDIFQISVFLIWLLLMVRTKHTYTYTIESASVKIYTYNVRSSYTVVNCGGYTKERREANEAGQRTRSTTEEYTLPHTHTNGHNININTYTFTPWNKRLFGKFINVRGKKRYVHIYRKPSETTHFDPKMCVFDVFGWRSTYMHI